VPEPLRRFVAEIHASSADDNNADTGVE